MSVAFDIALTNHSTIKGRVGLTMPAAIGRALIAKGYNRATVTLTDEGILLRPYVAEKNGRAGRQSDVALPEWDA